MRIIALDYGDKNIGVAISDPTQRVAFGLETIRRDNPESFKKLIARLKEIIKENGVSVIVLGYPKNMDNSEGERCKKTTDFSERLKRNFKNISIVLWDERLSSVSAERILIEGNLNNKKRNLLVDKVAATYILQSYLESLNK